MSYSYDAVRARIQNITKKTGLKPDVIYQRYFIERFIARMAASEHNESIVIKGGMLISAMTGIDMRATKDLDATIIGNPLTKQDFEKIALDVVAVNLDDNIYYEFVRAEEIMLDNNYPCCRIHLRALLGKTNAKIEIDLTSGDAITPKEIDFGFPSLFGGDKIKILAYNLETILAEKMTAVLDLGVFNTRAKDFYDIYLLTNTLSDKFNNDVLQQAFRNTISRRKKENLLANVQETITQTLENQDIRRHWEKYRVEYSYAADIEFEQIEASMCRLFEWAGYKIKIEKPANLKDVPKTLAEKLAYNQKRVDEADAVKVNKPNSRRNIRHDRD